MLKILSPNRSFTEYTAAVTACAFTVSLFFEAGFFSIIGPDLKRIMTPIDYVSASLDWFPAIAVIMIIIWITSVVSASIRMKLQTEASNSNFLYLDRFDIIYVILVFLITFFLIISLPPNQYLVYLSFGVCLATVVLRSAIARYAVEKDTSLILPFLLIINIMQVIMLSYSSGGILAILAKYEAADSLISVNNEKKPFQGILLRSLEKGVIFWVSDQQAVKFLNWNDITEICHLPGSISQPSLLCTWTNIFCAPTTAYSSCTTPHQV